MLISKFLNCDIDAELSEKERRYNIVFPSQYKLFMHKYNGGYTPKTKFNARKISSDLRGFYGMGDVKLSIEKIDLDNWIELETFPIACDSFGNYIVIGIGANNNGKIYFCDHEKQNVLESISNDLKSFLKCCKSEVISEASRRSIKEREELLIAKGRGSIITDSLRQMWQAEIDKYADMVQEEVFIN